MEYVIIALCALFASGLTFFSGFGLGTILVPVFALFFPIEIAISLTAIVHFLNNLFKLTLVAKKADLGIVLRFGIPSFLAAFLGAYCLSLISHLEPLYTYSLAGRIFLITPVKLSIAFLILFFSLFEWFPYFKKLEFDQRYLIPGGLLSGFFGGLSGNQGALRSAFLIRAGLSKDVYIASGVMIACMVDVSRLAVYSNKFSNINNQQQIGLVICATLSAFVGAYFGNQLIKKITIKSLQLIVSVMLFIFGILLGAGII